MLSFRKGITDDGKMTSVWYELLTAVPTRFLTGVDSCTPRCGVALPELAAETRGWLRLLAAGCCAGYCPWQGGRSVS